MVAKIIIFSENCHLLCFTSVFLVNALRAIVYGGVSFSIDMNALRAIVYDGVSFSIDMNALRAIVVDFALGKKYQ